MAKEKLFSAYYKNQYLWVRVFGYGLHFKNVNRHPLTFSERGGYVKRVQIGFISIKYLPKIKTINHHANKRRNIKEAFQ